MLPPDTNVFFSIGKSRPDVWVFEAHQGVMADRRHSLKRGDRLSKLKNSDKRQLLTGKKATNCDLCYGLKVTATFITIKQATKQLQNE